MKKRLFVVIIVLALLFALTGESAKAGPPWRAIIRQIDDYCYTEWLADDLTTITYLWMDMHEVYQPNSGIKNGTCNGQVDYSSPDFASISDICAYTDWSVFCNGQGNMSWGISNKDVPIWCFDEYGNLTYNTEGIATKAGQVKVTCHWKLPTE